MKSFEIITKKLQFTDLRWNLAVAEDHQESGHKILFSSSSVITKSIRIVNHSSNSNPDPGYLLPALSKQSLRLIGVIIPPFQVAVFKTNCSCYYSGMSPACIKTQLLTPSLLNGFHHCYHWDSLLVCSISAAFLFDERVSFLALYRRWVTVLLLLLK